MLVSELRPSLAVEMIMLANRSYLTDYLKQLLEKFIRFKLTRRER